MTVITRRALGLSPVLLTAWWAACSKAQPTKTAVPITQPGLAGTAWRLVEFRGSDDTRLSPDEPAKYTIAFRTDGTLDARLDCNRGRGSWKSAGPKLELGPLALTRMACPPGSLHDQLVKQWAYIRSYVMKDGHLFLALMADGGIYQFEPASDTAPSRGAKLEGTATYRERMALPPGAVFEAQLEDVTRADAQAEVLGRTSIRSPGNPPIQFAIAYDPARIEAGRAYVVRARILVDGKPFFTTDDSYPVLTRSSPATVSLMLRRAGGAPAAGKSNATLENTYWRLTALDGEPARVADNIPEPHLLLHPADNRASGSSGCNQFSGSYQLSGDSLRFGPLTSTLRACVDPELNRQERAFLDALAGTRRWQVNGDSLLLSGKAGPVARFAAQ